MLRYRRYRAFILFAIALVFLFYHFGVGGGREWDTGKYSADYLRRQLGLKSGAQSENSVGGYGDDESGDGRERTRQQQPIELDIPAKAKEEGTVPRPATLENVERPKQSLPEDFDELARPDAAAPAGTPKPKPGAAEEYRGRVAPDPTRPWLDVPIAVGQSRKEVQRLPGHEDIHFEKASDHFPVKTIITLPTDVPRRIPRIQFEFKDSELGKRDEEKLGLIKDAFTHAWKGYKEKAWGQDELRPVSGEARNPFNGWGATLVDALDTLWIMGMREEFDGAVEKVSAIDFTSSARADIPLSETTIRYLGGLLSAYDLSGGKHKVLLKKAEELGTVLLGAFDTPNRMPISYYYWRPAFASQPHRASNLMNLSELGSLSMEFTRLAQLTKDSRYYDAVARVTSALHKWQNATRLPGLWPIHLDASGCEREQYNPPTKQADGTGSKLTVIDKWGNENVDPPNASESPAPPKFNPEGITGSADGIGVPAQVEFSRLRDHAEKLEVPPDYVEIETPPPLAFTVTKGSGKEEKADQTQKFDGSNTKKSPSRGGAGTTVGYAGTTSHVDVSEGGKEMLRDRDSTADDGRPGKIQHVHVAKYGIERSPQSPFGDDIESAPRVGTRSSEPYARQKRQLGAEQSEQPMETIPKTTLGNSYPTGDHSETEESLCFPRGLASVSKYGREEFSLGAMADSTYEYLPKEYILLGGLNREYKDMYEAAASAATKHLIFRPMLPDNDDILVAGNYVVDNPERAGQVEETLLKAEDSHLDCFVGGMFGLGARIFNRTEDMMIAQKLTQGCVWAYESTASGIMPEQFTLVACKDKVNCEWNETAYYEVLDSLSHMRQKQTEQQMFSLVEKDKQENPPAQTLPIQPAPVANKDEVTRMNFIKREISARGPPEIPVWQPPTKFDGSKKEQQSVEPTPPVKVYDVEDLGHEERPSPLTHKEFVAEKIKNERLPLGYVMVNDRQYILRPEAIESVWYMHRLTGDPHWREAGWRMFQAIEKHTKVAFGHSAIDDVTSTSPHHKDEMESFWLSETLKYFYLLFAGEDEISLDEWVLNSEAHPLKRPDGIENAGD